MRRFSDYVTLQYPSVVPFWDLKFLPWKFDSANNITQIDEDVRPERRYDISWFRLSVAGTFVIMGYYVA